MTFKEYVKAMPESELKAFLIDYNDRCKRFENFLISKIGKEEYAQLCMQFAKQEITDFFRNYPDHDSDRGTVSESFWREKGWYEDE